MALVLGWSMPRAGVDLPLLQRFDFLLCALVAFWLWWEPHSAFGRFGRIGVWMALASAAVLVYLNFFAFHGARTFVHLHDVGHYYLGSKYFAELEYDGLYTAMLRAEAELYEDRFKTLEARDLVRDKLVHIRTLLEESEAVKQRFDAARWRSFQQDVGYFRERLGDNLGAFYRDHGFNPTPAWAGLGGLLVRAVPPPSKGGLRWLTLIDSVLILGMLGAVWWAFGPLPSVLSLSFFCLAFGANFSWTGGAFLRQGWLVGVVVGLCCLARGRPILAGALLGSAALLRVFPILFLAGPAAVALLGHGRSSDTAAARRLLASAVITLAVGFGLSCLTPGGIDNWRAFRLNAQRFVETVSPNVVGATPLLAFQGRPGLVTEDEFDAIRIRRATIHRWQILLLGLPTALLVAFTFRRGPVVDASVAGGLLLAFMIFSLAGYYYVFLLLVLLHPDAARVRRAGITLFVGEALVYGLALFEPTDGVRYLYRSTLVLYVLFALYGDRLRQGLPFWSKRRPNSAADPVR